MRLAAFTPLPHYKAGNVAMESPMKTAGLLTTIFLAATVAPALGAGIKCNEAEIATFDRCISDMNLFRETHCEGKDDIGFKQCKSYYYRDLVLCYLQCRSDENIAREAEILKKIPTVYADAGFDPSLPLPCPPPFQTDNLASCELKANTGDVKNKGANGKGQETSKTSQNGDGKGDGDGDGQSDAIVASQSSGERIMGTVSLIVASLFALA